MARKRFSARKTFDLHPDTATRLHELAVLVNDSESAIVREALNGYLDKALKKAKRPAPDAYLYTPIGGEPARTPAQHAADLDAAEALFTAHIKEDE